jgi:hypothetical protein
MRLFLLPITLAFFVYGDGLGQHNFDSQIKAFGDYIHDFQAMEKTVQGEQFEAITFLEDVASKVDERVEAITYTLRIYDKISLSERRKVQDVVREQLKLNTSLIRYDSERITGMLPLVRLPAVAQIGLKMRDDMRSLAQRLETVASSLD